MSKTKAAMVRADAVKAAAPYTYKTRPASDGSSEQGDIDEGRFID